MAQKPDIKDSLIALAKLPPPVPCFANGAACPWCGALHQTVTFGSNSCLECSRPFQFGYPDWEDRKDPVSWVAFPHREFEAVGFKVDLLPDWKPNDRLKNIYHRQAEQQTGIRADSGRPN